MMLDLLLALALVLASATQLRLADLPLGAGELCIVLWIGLSIGHLILKGINAQTGALLGLLGFWGTFAFALSVGALIGFMLEPQVAISDAYHDASAYLLMAIMTCSAVAMRDANTHMRRTAWLYILFSSVSLLVQIAAGWDAIQLPSVEPWYFDRFRGWSANPNQLALNCCIMTLLALHLAANSAGYMRALGLLGAVAPLVAGRLSKSDTFISVMILCSLVLLVLWFRRWLISPKSPFSLRYTLALLVVIFALPLAASLEPFAGAEAGVVEQFAIGLTKDQGGEASERTVELRLYLWKQAATVGIESGWLGLGPGPHLEPPEGMTGGHIEDLPYEAHSTPLDVFLQGGILAVAALFALLVSAIVLAYRASLDVLTALIIAITIFSTAHFVIRHPAVWFALALCVSTAWPRTGVATGRQGS